MKSRLWHSAGRYTEVKGDIIPRFQPLSTSFLALTVDGRSPVVHSAYSEYGEVVETNALQLHEAAALVTRKYRTSCEYSTPLVVVLGEPRNGFSGYEKAVYDHAKRGIERTRTREMKRHVTIPKVLVVPRRNAEKQLFGARDLSEKRLELRAEEVMGVDFGGTDVPMIRSICLSYCLGRSTLGKVVTPLVFKGVDYS